MALKNIFHRTTGVKVCAMLGAALFAGGRVAAADSKHPIVSTTIDFLDYCFCETNPDVGYFTENQYENVIRQIADSGIRKVYLRVDVCGLTLYPTKIGKQYAGDGRDPGSTYLVNTLRHYDPAAKTIALGHKYGLQVWAWDTLFDDEATMVWYADPEDERRIQFGEYPLKDPFLIRNPHYQWQLDPRIEARQQAQAQNPDRNAPITAVRLKSDTVSRPNRVTEGMFALYVSADNRRYHAYQGPRTFKVVREQPAILEITGLEISEPYLKLAFNTPWERTNTFTISGEPDAFAQVFHAGKWHNALADFREQNEPPEQGSFDFSATRFAWDFGARAMGIAKFIPPLPRYYGIIELAYPEASAYKLERLRELAAYPFDGFAYSIRTHTRGRKPENYGYNASTCDAFKARYGKNIRTDDFDRQAWLDLRAEAVNNYLVQAGKLLSPRPLYMDYPRQEPKAPYIGNYGGLPFQAAAWAQSAAVTGIRMLGFAEDKPITPRFENANSVRIIRFVDNWRVPPPDEFRANLRRWLANPALHEIEYYETLLYTRRPRYFTIIREEISRR